MTAPDFRLYNTLTRKVESFSPADGKTVRIYTCGPTVYRPAHLGNFRTFLFEDLLRRAIELRGWKVKQVMNLTDVDDKIIKAASEQGTTIAEVTAPITKIFHADRAFLRIQDAELYPKATDHIPEMIEIVKRLVDKKLAYKADDGSVYFAIDKFKDYGKLSRLDTREVKAGARVIQDDYSKENAQDFALWKAAKPEDERTGAAWDSPWGRGRPGWHLECSAMAMKYLGETLDIHCGGIDLIFPHHEDEIAQSEGSTGKLFSRFWCHGEFLLTEGSKMAKRLGNVATVQDLRDQGVPAAAFRHFVFSTHYRKQLNMSSEALEGSIEGVRRIGDFVQRLAEAKGATPELEKIAADAEAEVTAALFDDLNAPIALGALFTFIRKANAELDRNGVDKRALETARKAFGRINSVLDVVPESVGADPEIARWVEERLTARKDARSRREFAEADRIRAEIESKGIAIEDTPHGTKWRLR
ncbi:MAG: cysteine--tRNA ligase [Gemmatimonadetes bacterium]|nr:MAG: cysteine--tRNA ligase [Gemmatimonadota bacterium]PYO78766.1 MAG: cysteine--tRNA ligase [Gemmatimonadota bacterium]